MGRNNIVNLATENIVALCDVDWGFANEGFDHLEADVQRARARLASLAGIDRERLAAQIDRMIRLTDEHLPRAKRYQDYREMLERQKDIDAVLVATPDHMHAPIALAAMELGKHVYVQKPLTWSVAEARQLQDATLARGYYVLHLSAAPDWQRRVMRARLREAQPIELPILPYAAAITYRLAGGEHLWITRHGWR